MKKCIIDGKKVFQITSDLDWTDVSGNTIAILRDIELKNNSDIKEVEDMIRNAYPDIFIKYVDTFVYNDEYMNVFLLNDFSKQFCIDRFKFGIRWWYDMFWDVNGPIEVDSISKNIYDIFDQLCIIYYNESELTTLQENIIAELVNELDPKYDKKFIKEKTIPKQTFNIQDLLNILIEYRDKDFCVKLNDNIHIGRYVTETERDYLLRVETEKKQLIENAMFVNRGKNDKK